MREYECVFGSDSLWDMWGKALHLRRFKHPGILFWRVGAGPLFPMYGTMDPLTYDALRALVEDTASLYGLQLVELKLVPRGPRWRLRVFVDRKGGVTVRECASVSRELSRSLDAEQLISHPYVLEVSSPGVDRPLRHRRDFALVEGRRVEMHMRGGEVLRGKVVSTSDEVVTVRLPDGELRRAELGQVERAALDVSLKGR